MENYATVVRLELSPEKLLAFQTDGEKWNRLQEIYNEVGSLETAIEQYKQVKRKDYEADVSMERGDGGAVRCPGIFPVGGF